MHDILDQLEQAAAFVVDFAGKYRNVLGFGHAALYQFGIAGNGGQRRAQLVADVGGEALARRLGGVALGHILQKHHQALVMTHGAGREQVFASARTHIRVRAALRDGLFHRIQQRLRPVVHGKRRFTIRREARMQDGTGAVVHQKHVAMRIQNEQSLVHMADDRFQFPAPRVDFPHLRFQAPVLLRHAAQHGRQLVVNTVLQRIFQVDFVDGPHQRPRPQAGEHGGRNQHHRDARHQRPAHAP